MSKGSLFIIKLQDTQLNSFIVRCKDVLDVVGGMPEKEIRTTLLEIIYTRVDS